MNKKECVSAQRYLKKRGWEGLFCTEESQLTNVKWIIEFKNRCSTTTSIINSGKNYQWIWSPLCKCLWGNKIVTQSSRVTHRWCVQYKQEKGTFTMDKSDTYHVKEEISLLLIDDRIDAHGMPPDVMQGKYKPSPT